MGLLGGIAGGLINPMNLAQLAMGPAGWMNLAVSTIGRTLVQQLGSQLIQNFGQQLGLPSSVINGAVSAYNTASNYSSGNFSGLDRLGNMNERVLTNFLTRGGVPQSEVREILQGMKQQAAEMKSDAVKDALKEALESINRRNDEKKLEGDIESIMKGKGSILMKIAVALGKLADNKMNEMAKTTEKMGKLGEIDGKNQAQYSEMNGKMQALGQELNMISQAMANVIKSVGEAGATLARKG